MRSPIVYGTLSVDAVNAVSDQVNPIRQQRDPERSVDRRAQRVSPTATGTPTINASSSATECRVPGEPAAAVVTAPVQTSAPAIASRVSTHPRGLSGSPGEPLRFADRRFPALPGPSRSSANHLTRVVAERARNEERSRVASGRRMVLDLADLQGFWLEDRRPAVTPGSARGRARAGR